MRQFAHPNLNNFECPVCHTSADHPVVLVGIPGTEEDHNIQAEQVHTDCYRVICKMNDVECEVEEL
jgi:hypothetical protein